MQCVFASKYQQVVLKINITANFHRHWQCTSITNKYIRPHNTLNYRTINTCTKVSKQNECNLSDKRCKIHPILWMDKQGFSFEPNGSLVVQHQKAQWWTLDNASCQWCEDMQQSHVKCCQWVAVLQHTQHLSSALHTTMQCELAVYDSTTRWQQPPVLQYLPSVTTHGLLSCQQYMLSFFKLHIKQLLQMK